MLDTLSQKFHAWTTGWRVLILFIAAGLMAGYIMPVAAGILALAANNSVLPLDLMFFYTPGTAFDMIEKYGPAGRDLYGKILMTVDILYPVIYTLFLGLCISWLFQRGFPRQSPMQKMNAVPVGGFLFDLLENIGIVSMLSMYPSIPAIMAWITMLISTVKWLFALASLGLIFVGLARAAMNRFRRQD
ncbi:MAG TPA: hypothetical protein VHO49_08245 [Anaerolineales bacterium]|nr:hypothetical protein [Anaerolineales bacterium]